MIENCTGRLLVATPMLEDPTFHRAVVLVLDHDEDGALGVVLNRTSSVPARDAAAPWTDLVCEPPVVFGGGPVEPDAVVALGRTAARVGAEHGDVLDEHVRLVDLSADPVLQQLELETVRLFAGYAGWAPGQLEGEVVQGAWFVVDAAPGDVFTDDPVGLWHEVLRRQPGDLALLATFPDDPTMN
ncbi:YqgE/AlgH family protein [Nitriliruptor alkaliphilus]|uniref:YqgE/AlgH family protein n=1 Tax=Nitriliruptor alkaliphilus TaxID=427918 RepID=UPI000B007967|nr:YqgE/AlgH family protein [Nitriliruptor alkaliphilus]